MRRRHVRQFTSAREQDSDGGLLAFRIAPDDLPPPRSTRQVLRMPGTTTADHWSALPSDEPAAPAPETPAGRVAHHDAFDVPTAAVRLVLIR